MLNVIHALSARRSVCRGPGLGAYLARVDPACQARDGHRASRTPLDFDVRFDFDSSLDGGVPSTVSKSLAIFAGLVHRRHTLFRRAYSHVSADGPVRKLSLTSCPLHAFVCLSVFADVSTPMYATDCRKPSITCRELTRLPMACGLPRQDVAQDRANRRSHFTHVSFAGHVSDSRVNRTSRHRQHVDVATRCKGWTCWKARTSLPGILSNRFSSKLAGKHAYEGAAWRLGGAWTHLLMMGLHFIAGRPTYL